MKNSKGIRLNNPFALIQIKPSPWLGLKEGSSGFLEFKDMVSGVRAGFINLSGYIEKRGLNTIRKIFPVYAPSGIAGNNPAAYSKFVSDFTGIGQDQVIKSPEELLLIGRAIIRMENGANISESDFMAGYRAAYSRIENAFKK